MTIEERAKKTSELIEHFPVGDRERIILEALREERKACCDRVLKEGVTSELQARVLEQLIMDG